MVLPLQLSTPLQRSNRFASSTRSATQLDPALLQPLIDPLTLHDAYTLYDEFDNLLGRVDTQIQSGKPVYRFLIPEKPFTFYPCKMIYVTQENLTIRDAHANGTSLSLPEGKRLVETFLTAFNQALTADPNRIRMNFQIAETKPLNPFMTTLPRPLNPKNVSFLLPGKSDYYHLMNELFFYTYRDHDGPPDIDFAKNRPLLIHLPAEEDPTSGKPVIPYALKELRYDPQSQKLAIILMLRQNITPMPPGTPTIHDRDTAMGRGILAIIPSYMLLHPPQIIYNTTTTTRHTL